MTCIVGWIEKDKVYIGGDSAGSNDSILQIRKDTKVFKRNGMVFGCAASFRMINLLKFTFKIPKHEDKISIDEYMNTLFIESVRKCFKEYGFSTVTNNEETGGTFLIGYRNRLFKIPSDYQIAETKNGFDASGSGMYYALGSLYTNKNNKMDIKKRLKIALESAEYYNPFVRKPFIIKSI